MGESRIHDPDSETAALSLLVSILMGVLSEKRDRTPKNSLKLGVTPPIVNIKTENITFLYFTIMRLGRGKEKGIYFCCQDTIGSHLIAGYGGLVILLA